MTFEQLAKQSLFVKPTDASPSQWIYAVDDAWLHSGYGDLKAVFSSPPTSTLESPAVLANVKATGLTQSAASQASSGAAPDQEATLPKRNDPEALRDHQVVESLFAFLDNNPTYGLCFCSFEFFFVQIELINRRENAVFFDLNHKLADSLPALKAKWAKNISTMGLFGTDETKAQDMTRLGWHLYFALKFGKIPGAFRCVIDPNHLLILSSAIYGEKDVHGAQTRASILETFLNIQMELWGQVDTTSASVEGQNFTFIPIPKVKDKVFSTGLQIFNNTFKRAANWETKKAKIAEDMRLLWNNPVASDHWGHITTSYPSSITLQSSQWLLGDVCAKKQDLRALYHVEWRVEAGLSIQTLFAFLNHAADRDQAIFLELPQLLTSKRVDIPTRPGILFVLALGELVQNLAKKNDTQMVPSISVEEETANGANYAALKMKIGTDGVKGLVKSVFSSEPKDRGATRWIRVLLGPQEKMLNEAVALDRNGIRLGDIAGPEGGVQNKTPLRERLFCATAFQDWQRLVVPTFDQGNGMIIFRLRILS